MTPMNIIIKRAPKVFGLTRFHCIQYIQTTEKTQPASIKSGDRQTDDIPGVLEPLVSEECERVFQTREQEEVQEIGHT